MRLGDTEPQSEQVAAWEAYHGAWIDKAHTLPAGAVRFFRFEDVTTKGCMASLSPTPLLYCAAVPEMGGRSHFCAHEAGGPRW